MPTIVGGAGGNNIDAIKRYFTDKNVIQSISNGVGIPYDELIGGHYKLLLEPIAYFTFKGVKWAMKGELYTAARYFLESLGYEVIAIDFQNPQYSNRYNFLQPLIDALNQGEQSKAATRARDMRCLYCSLVIR